MEASYIQERITQLRLQKGISEYKMSYDLGHSRGYINNISSGKTLPSMAEFLAICDYFGITPKDFFDTEKRYPSLDWQIVQLLSDLKEEDLKLVYAIISRLSSAAR